jgi:hypothetical protein
VPQAFIAVSSNGCGSHPWGGADEKYHFVSVALVAFGLNSSADADRGPVLLLAARLHAAF